MGDVNFSLKLVGFLDEYIQKANEIFSNIIVVLIKESGVNVAGLKQIIVAATSDSYIKELKAFENNPKPSNNQGISPACTYLNPLTLESHTVINGEFFNLQSLFDGYTESNSDQLALIAHTIYHELCHVEDNNQTINIFPSLLGIASFQSELDRFYYSISKNVWSEFNVCSKANSVPPDREESYREILLLTLNSFDYELNQIYTRFRIQHSLVHPQKYSQLLDGTHVLVHKLFMYSAYYLGDLSTKDGSFIHSNVLEHKYSGLVLKLQNVLLDVQTKVFNGQAQDLDIYQVGELANKFLKEIGLVANYHDGKGVYVELIG